MRRLLLLAALVALPAACGGSSSPTTAVVPIGRGSDLTVVAVTFDPPSPRVGEVVTATIQWVDLGGDESFPVPITLDLVLQPDALGRVCSWETDLALGRRLLRVRRLDRARDLPLGCVGGHAAGRRGAE